MKITNLKCLPCSCWMPWSFLRVHSCSNWCQGFCVETENTSWRSNSKPVSRDLQSGKWSLHFTAILHSCEFRCRVWNWRLVEHDMVITVIKYSCRCPYTKKSVYRNGQRCKFSLVYFYVWLDPAVSGSCSCSVQCMGWSSRGMCRWAPCCRPWWRGLCCLWPLTAAPKPWPTSLLQTSVTWLLFCSVASPRLAPTFKDLFEEIKIIILYKIDNPY